MNIIKNTASAIFTLLFLGCSTLLFAQKKEIPSEQLPPQAKSFLQKYFPDDKVMLSMKETEDLLFTSYEVRLTSGTGVEFDQKGQWKEVKASGKVVPAAIIPATISTFVKNRFPGHTITKIDKDSRGGHEIKLSNNTELEFNKKGELVDIDD